ncbi:epithelial-stromal interaction protein 1 isoform X4 [Erinaceus europaeus]|uniref:Epithelial-stromal interaction protein 1 isoform X4 n=1 Tax=Erinaceus europaeus TaxID=9365 RepID=A0ABM3XPL0_ERIEU|nr:epithelial-stromal interaction protein 1 isoform X4 [Erinaceus europaeus]
MSTRSKVVGSGPGSSFLAQKPSMQPRDPAQLQGPKQALEDVPQGTSRGSQEQRLTGAYTLITPNENRRSRIQRIAEQELESLEKWKEQHRAKPVSLVPRRLGGSQSEAEVRQKQQLQLIQSKYQQKLKREQSMRIKKEAEEAAIQKMKAIQREKSNKMEEKQRLQEQLRREAFCEHRQYKTAEFLSRLDAELPNKNTCQNKLQNQQSSTWGELLEFKRQQQEEERIRFHQSEQRRVNNAFLDQLQGRSQPGGLEPFGGYSSMNSRNSWGL